MPDKNRKTAEEPLDIDTFGEIAEGEVRFTIHCGKATFRGKEIQLQTTTVGEMLLYFGMKSLRIPWEHVLWLAEKRGLLSEL